MKKSLIFIIPVLVVVIGYLSYSQIIKPKLEDGTVAVDMPMTIKNDDLGFEFTYPSGETAYTLIEPSIPTSTADGLKKVAIVMNTKSYQDFASVTEATEPPPAVSIFVLEEIDNPSDVTVASDTTTVDRLTRIENWAKNNSQYTSYSLKTAEPERIEIDGIKALRYKATGLYEQEINMIGYKGNIYIFVGQYESESDEMLSMYKNLISSLAFY